MTVVRRLARPMLAATFVKGGLDSLRHPAARAEIAAPVIHALAEPLRLPDDPELLVRANGAVMVTAGTLFGLGRLPRLSALVLAASLVPTTYAGHPFWQEKDPAKRAAQTTHFLKNLGLLGGLLLASVDTEGRPGVAWRARRAATDVRRQARHLSREAKLEARLAAKSLAP